VGIILRFAFNRIAHYCAGHFACFMATHTIRDKPKPVFWPTEKAVFVIVAH
jgi:hypothetical protein